MDHDILLNQVVERLNKLGIQCDGVPTHKLTSATTALSCFPMYMVASVATWSDDSDRQMKLNDVFGIASLREAYAIGEQETRLVLDAEHAAILHSLLTDAKPPLLVVYEYALETLRMFLSVANSDLVELVKMAVARMMVAVAMASGEGWFGVGGEPTDEQRKGIRLISEQLGLQDSPTASVVLEELSAMRTDRHALWPARARERGDPYRDCSKLPRTIKLVALDTCAWRIRVGRVA